MFTAWWPGRAPDLGVLKHLSDCWPEGTASFEYEADSVKDTDRLCHHLRVYVRIFRYPENWLDVVRESLREFTDNGAAVAWVGGYECLLYYSADTDFAGCYAAYTDDTGLICRSGLDEPFRYIRF